MLLLNKGGCFALLQREWYLFSLNKEKPNVIHVMEYGTDTILKLDIQLIESLLKTNIESISTFLTKNHT